MRRSRLVTGLNCWAFGLCLSAVVAASQAFGGSIVEISQIGMDGRTRLLNHLDCPDQACVGKARIELENSDYRPLTVDVAVAFRRGAAMMTMKSNELEFDFGNQNFASIPIGLDGKADRRVTVYQKSPLLKSGKNPLLHSPVIRVPVARLARLRVKIVPQ